MLGGKMNSLIIPESSSNHLETPFLQSHEALLNRFVLFLDTSPETITTYKKSLRQFFIYLQENNIINPRREDIIAYRDSMKKNLQSNTVQLYMVAVRLFFSWLSQEGLYPNIAFKIKGARVGNAHKRQCLTVNQLQNLISFPRITVVEKRDYAIILLMTTGGLRDIEISRANIEDLQVIGDNVVLYIQGKGRDEKDAFVLIPSQIDDAIRDYLKERNDTFPSSPLFCSTSNNSRGNRLSTRSVSGIVKSRLITAGYDSPHLTAHSLRHSAATISMLNGSTLEETQQFLRHSNLNTTMIYLHHFNRMNNKSEERIANAIFEK